MPLNNGTLKKGIYVISDATNKKASIVSFSKMIFFLLVDKITPKHQCKAILLNRLLRKLLQLQILRESP